SAPKRGLDIRSLTDRLDVSTSALARAPLDTGANDSPPAPARAPLDTGTGFYFRASATSAQHDVRQLTKPRLDLRASAGFARRRSDRTSVVQGLTDATTRRPR